MLLLALRGGEEVFPLGPPYLNCPQGTSAQGSLGGHRLGCLAAPGPELTHLVTVVLAAVLGGAPFGHPVEIL